MSTDSGAELGDCQTGTGHGACDPDCSICTELITLSARSIIHIPCSTTWHESCLLTWDRTLAARNKNTTCPICRRPFLVRNSCRRQLEFYQTLPGWTLVLENLQLIGSSWLRSGPGYIETSDTVFRVLNNDEIVPEDVAYYQRLVEMPSRWHVLSSFAELRDIVGSEALDRNSVGELYTRQATNMEWRGGFLSAQDFYAQGEVHDFAWLFYSFPGFSQHFLVSNNLSTELPSTKAIRCRRLIEVLESPSDLLDLWPIECLRQFARRMSGNLEPSDLPRVGLAPEAPAQLGKQYRRGVRSWELWKICGTNLAYAIPARATIVPATQFLGE